VPRVVRFSTIAPVDGLAINCAGAGEQVADGSAAPWEFPWLARSGSKRAVGRHASGQSAAARRAAPKRAVLPEMSRPRRSEARSDASVLHTSETETCFRPRAHALTTEIARVLVHPSAAQAILLGNVSGRKKRGLETLQRLKFLRDESR
jgi:hypothetical protein